MTTACACFWSMAIFTAAKIMSYRQEEIDFRDIWMLLLTVDSHVTKKL